MTPLAIVHEDDRLIAVDKPAGLPVIPGRNLADGETLVALISTHIGGKAFVVHRLDRETSGIIIFAKDAAAHRDLSMQFEGRSVTKNYRALALGRIEKDGAVEAPIRQFGSGRMGIGQTGKPAVTAFRVITSSDRASLLDVSPATGRRHQIRVHLYSIGHPVMGDPVYGVDRPVGGCPRLMLHALQITFKHPDGHVLTLSAVPGPAWENLVQQFGGFRRGEA
jgi:tRNA pseudouridine32 synthase / 23S rRNA pseudouridine746 synthase